MDRNALCLLFCSGLLGCGGHSATSASEGAGAESSVDGGRAGAGSPGTGRGGAGGGAGSTTPGAGGSAPGAGGSTPGAGGSAPGAAGGYLTVDDERPGRPAAPESTGGFLWPPNSAGAKIGNWFVTSDKTRDALPSAISPPRAGSTRARRASGQGLASGAVLWVQLDHPANRVLDLNAYSGMVFWARLQGVASTVVVSLDGDPRVSGALEGRATLPSVSLSVVDTWQQFKLPFDAFGLSDLNLASIEFFVGDQGETFDLWVDDFGLVCDGVCP